MTTRVTIALVCDIGRSPDCRREYAHPVAADNVNAVDHLLEYQARDQAEAAGWRRGRRGIRTYDACPACATEGEENTAPSADRPGKTPTPPNPPRGMAPSAPQMDTSEF